MDISSNTSSSSSSSSGLKHFLLCSSTTSDASSPSLPHRAAPPDVLLSDLYQLIDDQDVLIDTQRSSVSSLTDLFSVLRLFLVPDWTLIIFFQSCVFYKWTQSAQTVLQCLSPIKQIPVWLHVGRQTIKLFTASVSPPSPPSPSVLFFITAAGWLSL